MSWPRWKVVEKNVGIILSGTRRVRSSYHESCSDVEHDLFSIECKSRKKLPKYLETCVKSVDIMPVCIRQKIPEFIHEGLAQAQSYFINKRPLLVLKGKGTRLYIGIMFLYDIDPRWPFPMVLWNDILVMFDLKELGKVVNPQGGEEELRF